MNNLLCSFSRFVMGGIETYFVRMFRWGKKNGYVPFLLLPIYSEINPIWENELKDLEVRILFYDYNYRCVVGDIIEHEKSTTWTIVSTSFDTYFACLSLVKQYGINKYSLYYYVLHPKDTITNGYIQRLFYKNFVIRPIWDNGLIFMDEETRDYCCRFYALDEGKEAKIVRLGLYFDGLRSEKKTNSNKEFTILSICRFDFPFKGYLFGLISDFARLYRTNENIKLIIVGDGAGRTKLEEFIKKVDINAQKKIVLKGQLNYNDITPLFDEADLYVGMGTTLLDAAKRKVVGIIAVGDQEGNHAIGFFHENIHILGALYEEVKKTTSFYDLICTYIDKTEEERQYWGEMTYEQAFQEYEIDSCMNRLTHANGKPVLKVYVALYIKKLFRKCKNYGKLIYESR